MRFLPSIFGPEENSLLGLDISSSAVKLLELSRAGNSYRVEAFANEPLAAGAVVDQQIKEPEQVGVAIARAVRHSGTSLRRAALAVSAAEAISKVIEMPSDLSEDEMESQINFEADQHIPFAIEEVNLDFQVLGPADRDEAVRVMLAACKRDTIDLRLAALEFGGLEAKVVDVETFALQNAAGLLSYQMPNDGVDSIVAIVDIGARLTKISILDNLDTAYIQERQFGGQSLTDDISRRLAIDPGEAEEGKLRGDLPEPYASEVLPSFCQDLGEQINRTLQLFYSAHSNVDTVDKILVTGGSAELPGLVTHLQQQLGVKTEVAKPFERLRKAGRSRGGKFEEASSGLLLAAGLALRAFDT
ncbi:MAG: type IV pilus assembly protein PilM [Salinisphaeraceae bacterium]|nr:type IV pilus assembly protein PilM [Salinisphaeraceae bacterium]